MVVPRTVLPPLSAKVRLCKYGYHRSRSHSKTPKPIRPPGMVGLRDHVETSPFARPVQQVVQALEIWTLEQDHIAPIRIRHTRRRRQVSRTTAKRDQNG